MILTPSVASSQQTTIDVALVFASDTSLSSGEKTDWFVNTYAWLDSAFAEFPYTIEVTAHFSALSISTKTKTAQNVLKAMQSDSAVSAIRSAGIDGADLVLMIASHASDGVCGRAGVARPFGKMPPLNVSGVESEHAAFAVVFVEESGCGSMARIIPHEIGHLLYAEHQESEDNNNNRDKPSQINHGIRVGTTRSIMYSPVNSETVPKWSGSSGLSGNWENNVLWLAKSHLISTVSNYRPLAIPSTASCAWFFQACHQPGCALWSFAFAAPHASEYRIERRTWSGDWALYATTSNSVYWPHLGQNGLYWRIRGENSLGSGDWCFFYTTGQCGGNGGGGGLIP